MNKHIDIKHFSGMQIPRTDTFATEQYSLTGIKKFYNFAE